MSTNYTTDNPRRSSRGGRRRRRGGNERSNDNPSSSNSARPRRSEAPKRAPKKLTLWQKIVAFFTGGSKPAAQPARAPRAEAPAARAERSERPDRPERTERAERAPREPRSGMRKPESVEVTTPRLYVGNLSFDATESDLQELFAGVGLVQNVEIVSNRATQRSKGFGFVQMQTIDEAKRAVSELHDKEYMGRKLVVSGAKAADRRDDREESAPEQPAEETTEVSSEPTTDERA